MRAGLARMERVPDERMKDTPGPPEGGTGTVGPPAASEDDSVAGNVELVIAPPLEPSVALTLHRWLKEVVNADIGEITGSWTGDTKLKITIRQPIPLLLMLAGLSVVAEVTEEPHAVDVASQAGTQEVGRERLVPKRFRLVLKAG